MNIRSHNARERGIEDEEKLKVEPSTQLYLERQLSFCDKCLDYQGGGAGG